MIGHQSPWKPKNGKISVIEDPGYSVSRLVLGHVGLDEPCEVVNDHEDIFGLGLLPQVSRDFHFYEIYVDQIHRLRRQDGYELRCLNLGFKDDTLLAIFKS